MRTRTPARIALYVLLALAAIVFVFPFYFMIVGALQEDPDHHPGRPAARRGLDAGELRADR